MSEMRTRTMLVECPTPEELSVMTAMDRAQHYHILADEYESEAQRYREIEASCLKDAFRDGVTSSSDGLYELHVKLADGVRYVADRDAMHSAHPIDAELMIEWQRSRYHPPMTSKDLLAYAREVKGLKGKEAQDYVRECSVEVPAEPQVSGKVPTAPKVSDDVRKALEDEVRRKVEDALGGDGQ